MDDELNDIRRRAGISVEGHTYAVVVPSVDTNLSISHPTVYTFKASSDDEALSMFDDEHRKANSWNRDNSRLRSGGVYWKNAILVRDDGKEIKKQ